MLMFLEIVSFGQILYQCHSDHMKEILEIMGMDILYPVCCRHQNLGLALDCKTSYCSVEFHCRYYF